MPGVSYLADRTDVLELLGSCRLAIHLLLSTLGLELVRLLLRLHLSESASHVVVVEIGVMATLDTVVHETGKCVVALVG